MRELQPVRTSVLSDEELLGGIGAQEAANRRFFGPAASGCTRGVVQDSPCSFNLGQAVRLRTCLALLEDAETQRTPADGRYSWVFRARPDLVLWCRWVAPAPPLQQQLTIYVDWLAVMSRRAAEVALRELPLRENVPYCRSLHLHREWCNPCVSVTHGVRTYGWNSRSPLAGRRPQFDIARHCQLRSEESRHTCDGFSGPNLTMRVDSDCPALDTPRFVGPFPNDAFWHRFSAEACVGLSGKLCLAISQFSSLRYPTPCMISRRRCLYGLCDIIQNMISC